MAFDSLEPPLRITSEYVKPGLEPVEPGLELVEPAIHPIEALGQCTVPFRDHLHAGLNVL